MIAGSNISKAKSNESPGENNSSGGGRSPSKNQNENEGLKVGSVGSPGENGGATVSKSKSQPSDNQIMIHGVMMNALNASTGEEESLASGGGDAYDKIKPLSKKSFDEDKTTSLQEGGGGNLHLKTYYNNITSTTMSSTMDHHHHD